MADQAFPCAPPGIGSRTREGTRFDAEATIGGIVGHDVYMRVVVAPDKFRGTASSQLVATTIGEVLAQQGHDVVELPLADGGEGLVEVLGGANRSTHVTGPLGDPVEARWRLHKRTAVLEMASASGLSLVGGAEGNDPIAASTTGTGELIAEAHDAGARRIIVGLGGSATTDGGLGALRTLYPLERLRGVELIAACDVQTRFVDAATVFGPQKGASAAQVELLRRRLERLCQVYLDQHGVDVTKLVGAGAAGGLAGGLAAGGASLISGFDLVADELEVDLAVADADLVITGEGFVDDASFEGKVVGGVIDLAVEGNTPVLVVTGEVLDGLDVAKSAGLTDDGPWVQVVSLLDRFGDRSFDDVTGCLREVVASEVG